MQQVKTLEDTQTIKNKSGLKLLSSLALAVPMFLGSAQKASADSVNIVDEIPATVNYHQSASYFTPYVNYNGSPATMRGFVVDTPDYPGPDYLRAYCLQPENLTPAGQTVTHDGSPNDAVLAVMSELECADFLCCGWRCDPQHDNANAEKSA